MWPSVAHESARSAPSTRCAKRGLAAAHRPNAPSTCSQAPAASAASAIASKASHDAGVHLAGLRADDRRARHRRRAPRASASATHPALVVGGIRSIEPVPRPMKRSARGNVECAFSPAKTRIGGAPVRPFSSTSQPTSASTWLRAAAIAVACAIWVPVTNANDRARGMPQQVGEPLAGDLLRDRRRRAGDVQARVLVPGRGQPVGGEGRRDGAADDEAEVARAGDRDRRLAPHRGEVGDDLARIGRAVGDRAAEPGAEVVGVDVGKTGRSGRLSRKSAAWSAVSRSSSRMSGRYRSRSWLRVALGVIASGSTRSSSSAGRPAASAASNAAGKSSPRSTSAACAPNACA